MRRTHQISRSRSGTGGDARRELEALAAGRRRRGSSARRARARRGRARTARGRSRSVKLKKSTWSRIADRDRADDGARERHHAADRAPRPGRAAACRADRARARSSVCCGRVEDHRRSPRGTRRSSRRGRHQLRADAGEAGEVGVRRRRRAPRRRSACGRAATTARRVMSGTTISTSSCGPSTRDARADVPRRSLIGLGNCGLERRRCGSRAARA